MSLKSLVSDLFKRVDDVFTPNQEKVIRLLTQQGYSVGGSCRRFEQHVGDGYIRTLVQICDYQILQKDGDVFVVGNIESIYYGSRTIGGSVGTLGMLCLRKDENCSLKSIRDRLGRTLSTKELLNQLRQGY